MNPNLIRIATAILLIVSPIRPLHVNAFEFHSSRNKSQSLDGNGTLLGEGSFHPDIGSKSVLEGIKRSTDVNASLQIFARTSQKSVNAEPTSLLESANSVYPTVEETSSTMDNFPEITEYKVHRTTTSTEDPPAQPDLLLLAKIKEIEAMEKNKEDPNGGTSQHRVSAIHAVAILISMRTASHLVQLLWE